MKNESLVYYVALIAIVVIVLLVKVDVGSDYNTYEDKQAVADSADSNLAGEAYYKPSLKSGFIVNDVYYNNSLNCSYFGDNYDPYKAGRVEYDFGDNITIGSADYCIGSTRMFEVSCAGSKKVRITFGTCTYGCASNKCNLRAEK